MRKWKGVIDQVELCEVFRVAQGDRGREHIWSGRCIPRTRSVCYTDRYKGYQLEPHGPVTANQDSKL